jgi:hypothetical protein
MQRAPYPSRSSSSLFGNDPELIVEPFVVELLDATRAR